MPNKIVPATLSEVAHTAAELRDALAVVAQLGPAALKSKKTITNRFLAANPDAKLSGGSKEQQLEAMALYHIYTSRLKDAQKNTTSNEKHANLKNPIKRCTGGAKPL